jgi:hypothetical protein
MYGIVMQGRFVLQSLPSVFFGIPQSMHENRGHVLDVKFGRCHDAVG